MLRSCGEQSCLKQNNYVEFKRRVEEKARVQLLDKHLTKRIKELEYAKIDAGRYKRERDDAEREVENQKRKRADAEIKAERHKREADIWYEARIKKRRTRSPPRRQPLKRGNHLYSEYEYDEPGAYVTDQRYY